MGTADDHHFNLPAAHRDHAGRHVAALAWTMAATCLLIAAILFAATIGASNG